MKYAIKFYQECGILDEVDELIIKYFERNINIFDFIENHKSQRIIMDITEHLEYKSDLDIFKALKEKYDNFSLMLSTSQVSFVDTLISAGISFFFAQGAVTPDMLEYFLNMGVSDVYIMNEMCFNLKEISKICKEKNVKIRVFPNIAQSSTTDIEDSDIVMNPMNQRLEEIVMKVLVENWGKYAALSSVLELITMHYDMQRAFVCSSLLEKANEKEIRFLAEGYEVGNETEEKKQRRREFCEQLSKIYKSFDSLQELLMHYYYTQIYIFLKTLPLF